MSLSVLANNTMSYAYSNIQAFSPPISIPNSNDFKKTVNSLMKILNERGERGNPCFTPQFTENQSVLKLLILTEHLTPLYKDLIARHICVSIPREVNFPHNKVLLIVSYAFFKIYECTKCRFMYNVVFF